MKQFKIAMLLLKLSIAFVAFMVLFSCGARKVNKTSSKEEIKQTEQTNIRTAETINETVTTTIDTTITTPERTSSYTTPLPIDSEPYVFEDDNIRSETSYNRNTGVLSNKITVKHTKIPVTAKSVTERQIKRDTDVKSDRVSESKSESKGKQVDRKGNSYIAWICLFIAIAYFVWFILTRKKKDDNQNKDVL